MRGEKDVQSVDNISGIHTRSAVREAEVIIRESYYKNNPRNPTRVRPFRDALIIFSIALGVTILGSNTISPETNRPQFNHPKPIALSTLKESDK